MIGIPVGQYEPVGVPTPSIEAIGDVVPPLLLASNAATLACCQAIHCNIAILYMFRKLKFYTYFTLTFIGVNVTVFVSSGHQNHTYISQLLGRFVVFVCNNTQFRYNFISTPTVKTILKLFQFTPVAVRFQLFDEVEPSDEYKIT